MNEKTFSNPVRDFMGILALAFTLFAILALVTYSPGDPSLISYASGEAGRLHSTVSSFSILLALYFSIPP
jgi:hypothetical protein